MTETEMPQLGDSIVFDNVMGLDEGDVITIPDDDDIVEIIEDDDNDVSNNDNSNIQSNTNIIPIPDDDGLTSDLFQLDEIKCMYCGKVFKRNSN